jgi:hypothetical protein
MPVPIHGLGAAAVTATRMSGFPAVQPGSTAADRDERAFLRTGSVWSGGGQDVGDTAGVVPTARRETST